MRPVWLAYSETYTRPGVLSPWQHDKGQREPDKSCRNDDRRPGPDWVAGAEKPFLAAPSIESSCGLLVDHDHKIWNRLLPRLRAWTGPPAFGLEIVNFGCEDFTACHFKQRFGNFCVGSDRALIQLVSKMLSACCMNDAQQSRNLLVRDTDRR